ncbi:MAG: ABC transporter permease [Armatimonadetes bacterium]|nr:ABC transporter permease [Armatimonadota bacterium]
MKGLGPFLQKYGVLVAFAALVVFNSVWQPDLFLRPENLRNLLNQNAAVGMVAVGMTMVIIAGGIDLSVGSLMAVAACLGVKVMNDAVTGGRPEGAAVALAVVVCIVAATVGGLVNGLLVTVGRVTPFIATLGGLVGYRSLALVLADGGEIRSQSPTVLPAIGQTGPKIPFLTNAQGQPLEFNWPILAFILVSVAGGLLLSRTVFGRNVIAVGANEEAAYLAGIRTPAVKLGTYVLLGLFAGIAAIGLAGRMNSVASAQVGLYYELDAIAAVAIGGTTMAGGYGRVWGTVVGVLILGIITNMLVTSGVSPYWQGFVKGVIILLAVLIQRGQSSR